MAALCDDFGYIRFAGNENEVQRDGVACPQSWGE